MIAREFLSDFRKAQDTFDWKYNHDNQIRGFLKSGEIGEAFDPIRATLFVKNQSNDCGSDPRDALGLSGTDIEAIIDAANNAIWKSVDGEWALDGYAAWLRDEIALAAGLEPEEVHCSVPGRARVVPVTSTEPVFHQVPHHG